MLGRQVTVARAAIEARLSALASACVHRRLEVADDLSRAFCEDFISTVRYGSLAWLSTGVSVRPFVTYVPRLPTVGLLGSQV